MNQGGRVPAILGGLCRHLKRQRVLFQPVTAPGPPGRGGNRQKTWEGRTPMGSDTSDCGGRGTQ